MKNYLQPKAIKLDPTCRSQNLIKEYLIRNASNTLLDKMKASGKNLPDCWTFIYNEIRNAYIEKNGRVDGGSYQDPEYVFGLAVHYFEEESIAVLKADEVVEPVKPDIKKNEPQEVEKPAAKPKPKKVAKKQEPESTEGRPQLSIFDLLGE